MQQPSVSDSTIVLLFRIKAKLKKYVKNNNAKTLFTKALLIKPNDASSLEGLAKCK